MPNLAGFLATRPSATSRRSRSRPRVGGVFALLVGLPLMRLSGLAAGIATFAVLEITNNILRYWEKIGPGLNTFSSVPETTGLAPGRDRRRARRRASRSPTSAAGSGGSSAPTREDPRRRGRSGCRSTASASSRSRSPARSRASRAASTSTCSRVNTESVYLDLTFITLAMLVIGGATSLWGAVVGALAVSGLDSFLAEAENGIASFGWSVDLPAGTRIVVVGALMALVLILRPTGLTGGREFSVRLARPRRLLTKFAR